MDINEEGSSSDRGLDEDMETLLYGAIKAFANPFEQPESAAKLEFMANRFRQTTAFDIIIGLVMALRNIPSSEGCDEVSVAVVRKTQELAFDFLVELGGYTARTCGDTVKTYRLDDDDDEERVQVDVSVSQEESCELKLARAHAHLQIAFNAFMEHRILWTMKPSFT